MNDTRESNSSEPVCLDQFLKLVGVAGTGGQAKLLIQGGEVFVNGELETRRRKKLSPDDVVQIGEESWRVKEFIETR